MLRQRGSLELWDLPKAMGFAAETVGLSALVDADALITRELLREMSAVGLKVEPRDTSSDAALARASAMLGVVPSLERVVLASVRSIVRLSSTDAQVDVSNSAPRWPGIVFVSFPLTSNVGDLRLLAQLRRFEHFKAPKCLRLRRLTPEGRHYSGIGGTGPAVIWGAVERAAPVSVSPARG
jgi:hypothetical protein